MAAVHTFSTQDVDDQAKTLIGWHQTYDQMGRGRFLGTMRELHMAKGSLLHETANRSLRQDFVLPDGHMALVVPIKVSDGSIFADRLLTPRTLMVLSSDRPYTVVSGGELEFVGLTFQRQLMEGFAPDLMEWLARADTVGSVALSEKAINYLGQRMFTLVENSDFYLESMCSDEQEDDLLACVLTNLMTLAESDSTSSFTTKPPRRTQARRKVIDQAIEFMRVNLESPIDMMDVCREVNVSRRTLQYAFEELVNDSPQNYFRVLRLNEARRRLKVGAGDRHTASITTIANDLGFSNASHFSTHYRQMFSESPSVTQKDFR